MTTQNAEFLTLAAITSKYKLVIEIIQFCELL